MVERESLTRHGGICLFIPDRAQEAEAGGISVSLNPAWSIHSEFRDSQSYIKKALSQKTKTRKEGRRKRERKRGRERKSGESVNQTVRE